jgi:serine/threonine protein kinase
MNPERQRVIDDLFDGVLDQPPEARAAWLHAQCTDAGLRAEVEALIEAHDRSDAIFDRNAMEVAGPLLRGPRVESQIGPYRLVRELGRGGMGIVYLAERADGQYRRRVAIKLLRNSPDSEELTRRFTAERQILASLNHPNIAQLLDGGVTDRHIPFLVMEYVDGVPITTYCDRQRLGIEERLQLFRDVCAAVHHAHQNLVIHRDIKPSNILVTAERRVKLLDFGIAKLLNPTFGPADQAYTRTEWRVMTPEYASPEQVRGDSLTTASDVYALGVLLYELLSGRRPHRLTSRSPQQLTEIIVQRDPLLPSIAVSRPEPASSDVAATDPTPEAIAHDRRLSVERLQRRLEGDLDAIMMMALRKESVRRYGSADLLWEDVQRHRDGLPVLAHRGTRWYRTRKFVSRHRLKAIAAAVVVVSLVGGTSVAVREAALASRERDRAEQALGQSKEVTEFLVRLFRTPAPAGLSHEQVTARDMLATGMARVEDLRGQPVVQAQMLDALGRVNDQLGRFDEAEGLLRRALELRRSQHGDNHADVAATLIHLSSVVAERGRHAEALQLSREALDIQKRALGPRSPEVAVTLSRVADMTADGAAAESLYRAARDIQRAALGPQALAVATTDVRLAEIFTRRGKYDEAEATAREVVAIRERTMGSEHASTAVGMIALAELLHFFRNQPVEAESLYHRALEILRKQSRPRPSLIAGALVGLESIAHRRGDHVRAEALAREVLDAHRRALGAEHAFVAGAMEQIAEHLAAQRRYSEAEDMLRASIALLQRTVGPEDFRTASTLIDLGRLHAAAGRLDEAEDDLHRALTILERLEGPVKEYEGDAAALLAGVIERRGRTAEASVLFDRAATILRPLPQRFGYGRLAAYAALADHYRAVKRPADEQHFRQLAGTLVTR